MSDYNLRIIKEKLIEAGLKKGDTIFCHSSLGFFGMPDKEIIKNKLAEVFFDCLCEIVGPEGTLIFPTFTYTFSENKNEIFDPNYTKSKMGILPEYVRQLPNSTRTMDPFYSSVIHGKLKEYFSNNIPNNSFGLNSVFDKFYRVNGKILNLNSPAGTLIHFFERKLSVKYRFDKDFGGEVFISKKKQKIKWTIYVRDLSSPLYDFDPFPLVKYIKENKIAKFTSLGKGEILTINCKDLYEAVKKNLLLNEWFLTKKYSE